MAPALTEPTSQTKRLSSSTTSVSPRPSSHSPSINNNISVRNIQNSNHNHSNNNSNSSSEEIPVVQRSINLSNGTASCEKINPNVKTSKGAFQKAFEETIAKQAAIQAAKQQQKEIQKFGSGTTENSAANSTANVNHNTAANTLNRQLSVSSIINGRNQFIELMIEDDGEKQQQMGPMCDTNQQRQSEIDELLRSEEEVIEEEPEEIELHKFEKDLETVFFIANDGTEAGAEQFVEHMECSESVLTSNEVQNQTFTTVNTTVSETSSNFEATDFIGSGQSSFTLQQECENRNTSTGLNDGKRIQILNIIDLPPKKEIYEEYEQKQQQQIESQTDTFKLASLTPPPSLHENLSYSQITTPQGLTTAMGLQKDFMKDSEIDISDLDLNQIFKALDPALPAGGDDCDLQQYLLDEMPYVDEMLITHNKDNETKEIHAEILKRQLQMQRKCDFFLRRLRKLQARSMGKHASEEIAGLFEWSARLVRRKDPDHTRQISYADEKHRPVTTESMKSFLKKLDAVATQQHGQTGVLTKHIGRPPTVSHPKPSMTMAPVLPSIDTKSAAQIENVSGMLQTELKMVQSALDSDVTYSSSGGESADEMVTYNNQAQQPLSIAQRAGWRWARDRSATISRWTWLLAQISDLEYRIRQCNELCQQIRKNKGSVTFEKQSTSSSSSPTPTSSVNISPPSSVNGYRGILPGNSKSSDFDAEFAPNGAYDTNSASGCCRTKPFQRSGFRKRKLLQTANVHTISKKAARPSTVKCGCQWPLQPCALCTGRPDPTAPRDLPDTMPFSERVALLDSCFHPVLSFPEDVSYSIHMEANARQPDWQNRVMRVSTKQPSKTGGGPAQKSTGHDDRASYTKSSKNVSENRKKTSTNRSKQSGEQSGGTRKLMKTAKQMRRSLPHTMNTSGGWQSTTASHQQFNKILNNKQRKFGSTSTIGNLHLNSGFGGYSLNDLVNSSFDGGETSAGTNGFLMRSKNSSPTHFLGGGTYKSERLDRRGRNSYDIDNIVIPYSVAAATRVEILPYKEIPTPKWRLVDDENEEGDGNNSNTENLEKKNVEPQEIEESPEEILFDAVQQRHDKALLEERRKFQTYLKYPFSTRSRANRRIDSRAESSGANTPDPTSPAPQTPSAAGDHESIPSPAATNTPFTTTDNQEGVESVTTNNQNLCSVAQMISNSCNKKGERRRTTSTKKDHGREDHRRSNTPDLREITPPFEPHQFPLSDELYETMLKLMPNDHKLLEECLKSLDCDNPAEGSGNLGSSKKSVVGTENRSVLTHPATITSDGVGTEITSNLLIENLYRHDQCLHHHHHLSSATTTTISAFEADDSMMEGSDTESADSCAMDDPNDPEWCEPA